MSALSYQARSATYHLMEELREPPAVAAVHRAALDEPGREDLLLRKLGPKGWGRVHHFRNYYGSGWGEKGCTLSPRALDSFFRFIEQMEFPAGTPSVFLTDRGGIELCWENRDGNSVQVEFTATGAEYYDGASNEEGFVMLDSLAGLPRMLST